MSALSGKSFGIVWVDAYNIGHALSATEKSATALEGDDVSIKANPLTAGEAVVVKTDGDLTMFTFHALSSGGCYITTTVGGAVKYLRLAAGSASLVDSPDEYCVLNDTVGTGETGADPGLVRIRSLAGTGSASLSINTTTSYGLVSSSWYDAKAAISDKSFFYLADNTTLADDDLVSYTAVKVSVSDRSQVKNGSKVVIYTRIWDEDAKEYVYYGVDHDGSLVRLYDEGETMHHPFLRRRSRRALDRSRVHRRRSGHDRGRLRAVPDAAGLSGQDAAGQDSYPARL